MKSDLITGLAGAIFSILYLIETSSIKIFGGAGTAGVNAQTVPHLWGGCLLALSLILIVRSIYKFKTQKKTMPGPGALQIIKEHREVAYTFILLILYAALMKPVGFILTSIVYVFLQIWVLTPIEKRCRKVKIMAGGLALFFSISLYFVFTRYLMVMLPPGILR